MLPSGVCCQQTSRQWCRSTGAFDGLRDMREAATLAPITRWSLPDSMLRALPEAADILAALAAEAFDVDPGRFSSPPDVRPAATPAVQGRSIVEIVSDRSAGRPDEVTRALGSALLVAFSPIRLMCELRARLLVPALDGTDEDLLGRCCSFVEEVLGDEELDSAVVLGMLEASDLDEMRWSRLQSVAGPLLLRAMDRLSS